MVKTKERLNLNQKNHIFHYYHNNKHLSDKELQNYIKYTFKKTIGISTIFKVIENEIKITTNNKKNKYN